MNGKKHMQVQRDQDTPSALHLAPNAKPVQVIQREPVAGQAYQRVLGGPRSFSPADLRSLQLTIGNQAVQRLLTGQRRTEATPLQRISEPTQNQGNTTSLPDTLKTGIETLSGLSMDDVQVHYNSSRPAEVQALAYTQGTDIHIGPDQKQHLPHEGWHVVQQKLGRVKPTLQASGVAINDDQELEKEADVMGARAGSMGRRALQDARSDPGSQLIAQGLPYVAQQNEGLMQRHGGQSVPQP